ncbi:unnamed protein product [Moneuplotes crassus]|uniref:EamA domain-containing protein n=1 Tax=Euplotes crassus TaxID=5936 RepID=A0AAD1XJA5_EUPCR|nr:unnamed protein product [Moneuplotes crassus]
MELKTLAEGRQEADLDILEEEVSQRFIQISEDNSALCSFNVVQDVDGSVVLVPDQTEKSNENVKGIILMLIAGVNFTMASITCKMVYARNDYLNGIDYLLVRSIIHVSISSMQILYAKVNIFDVKKELRLVLILRSTIGVCGMPCYFIAIKYIPLSLGTLIFNINPLIVGILSYLILKENITWLKVIALVGAFTGIFILTFHKDEDYQAGQFYMLGLILVGINCCTAAANSLTLRALNKQIHYLLSPFWFFCTSLLLALVILAVYPSAYHFSKFTIPDLTIFLLSALFTYGGQILSSKSLKYAEASLITPLQYLNILYFLITDIVVFHSKFTVTDATGGALILISLMAPVCQSFYSKYWAV